MNKESEYTSNKLLPPLPERMRPHNLDEYVGQKHLVGEGCILRNMISGGNLTSFILWGPPLRTSGRRQNFACTYRGCFFGQGFLYALCGKFRCKRCAGSH